MEEKINKTKSVFISHIGDEAPVALKLKNLLQKVFAEAIPVFVSSDYESISTGEEWYRRIVESIKSSKVVIVLISKESIGRPWINFEAGVGAGSNAKVFPVAIRGFSLGDLKPPLQPLHARNIHDTDSIRAVIRDVGVAIKQAPKEFDAESFVAEIYALESRLRYKGIVLTPFNAGKVGDAWDINFELSNTGNQDLELIKIEVFIPDSLISSQALHSFDSNYIDTSITTIDNIRYLKMTYKVYEGAPNLYFGYTEPLPKHFTKSMPPHVFRNFRTRIKSNLIEAELSMVIRHQVYVREFNTEMQELSVRELLNTPKLSH